MARRANARTQGWYYFEDGTVAWFHGLSAQEKKVEIFHHGKIIRFVPTNN